MRVWVGKSLIAVTLALALILGGVALQPAQAATQRLPAFTFAFTCASAVDYASGRVCVHTRAGTVLTLTVRYCSGYLAVSKSLKGTLHANGAGNASWWWHPMTKCRGRAIATVRAIWHGVTYWRTDAFIVR